MSVTNNVTKFKEVRRTKFCEEVENGELETQTSFRSLSCALHHDMLPTTEGLVMK